MGASRIAVWKMLFPDKYDLEAFEALFGEELDSWFSAGLACCDACFEEYARVWPGLTASVEFQSSSTPLSVFYGGSDLQEVYSEGEFEAMCREMGCPHCGRPLDANIWLFEPRFYIPKTLVPQIKEIEAIAESTPFLLLTHPLAERVSSELESLAARTPLRRMAEVFSRAREIGTPHERGEFLPPPKSKCREGRYNHAGKPVLYLASSHKVAFMEVGEPERGVLVASVSINDPLRILDLTTEELPSDLLRAITASSLLSAPTSGEGWDKPEYRFSRFVADCARHAGYSAIMYPSIADASGMNLVVLAPLSTWTDLMEVRDITEHHGVPRPAK